MLSSNKLSDNFLDDCSFLLGAGASKDANIPVANELFEHLISDLENQRDYPRVDSCCINYLKKIYSLSSNNFEKTVATIEILSRFDLEQDSFNYAIKLFSKDWPKINGKEMDVIFNTLYQFIVYKFLPEKLEANSDKVLYLRNLIKLSEYRHLPIFTLNYDDTIEKACKIGNNILQMGFDQKENKFTNQFIEMKQGISLYKLHGSIDWQINYIDGENYYNQIIKRKPDYNPLIGFSKPALILGENKLTEEGHFLELLYLFRSHLQKINQLCIVGYSFQDRHINKILREWFSSEKSVLIIDPNPPIADLSENKLQYSDLIIGSKLIGRKKISIDDVFRKTNNNVYTLTSTFNEFLESFNFS
ncbi:MAG: hypothetical protein GY821_13255 [Gammaproteobacteria bacterium]|nr:hypothetical protein [Gammaproteobacteria bacterium]